MAFLVFVSVLLPCIRIEKRLKSNMQNPPMQSLLPLFFLYYKQWLLVMAMQWARRALP